MEWRWNFLRAALNLLLGAHSKEADFSALTYMQSAHRGIFIHTLHAPQNVVLGVEVSLVSLTQLMQHPGQPAFPAHKR